MKLKLLLIPGILLLFLTGTVFGAVTGKITGTITDAANGQPLVGVTIAVQGTNWGAVTDPDGRYSIINVPVGTYTIVLSAVGYAKLEISNVEVHADLATYESHTMTSQVQELGTTIKVISETPLVIKDKTTSVNIVSKQELQALPTRGFAQVVGIQNSVVRMNSNVSTRQRGFRESLANGPEINLRGGRPSEVAYYVDGFSQQDPLTGISTSNISNNAIQEVSVTSGAFSAEYGHVASGIVNVTTNSGTDQYHAEAEAVTDNFASGSKNTFDQNYYSGDVGGPIPGLNKGYFFFSGERRYLGDRSPSSKSEEVLKQYGMSGNRLPNNALSGWSYQGKLDYNLTPNLKLTVNGNGSVDDWQEFRESYFNPQYSTEIAHTPRYIDKNVGLNAKITHTLNSKMFYNLSGSYFVTSRFRGDGVLMKDLAAYERPVANPEYDYYNLFRQGRDINASDFNPLIDPGSPEDTFVTFYDSYYPNYLKRKSAYIGLKGDFNEQVNASNTVKLGFDFQRHTLRYFENLNATQGYAPERVNRYGYDSLGNESDNEGYKNSTKHPINLGLYAQDRFDWRGLILNAGLRFDYFDYKALVLKDSLHPFGTTGDGTVDLVDLKDSKKFTRVSPRIGISFPVSEITQMHINYGKFYQRPDLDRLYTGYDFLEARVTAGSFYPFPSPNLQPEKITQYEFGVTHQLGENTAFDIVAYYKDVEDLTQIIHINNVVPKAYDVFGNSDYGTIKGFDFSLNVRRTRNIAINLKYSLSYANGTGSYAQSQYNIAWKNSQGTPKATAPLDYDQRHSIIGIFDYRTGKGQGPVIGDMHPLENFGLSVVTQLASGTPYTPMQVYDGVSPNASVSQIPRGSINSANMPWTSSVDMKIEKTFKVGNYNIVPYFWIRNLLDTKNVTAVYEGTGKAYTSGYLDTPEGQVRASDPAIDPTTGNTRGYEFEHRYELGQNNPLNYSNPRMILFGVRASF